MRFKIPLFLILSFIIQFYVKAQLNEKNSSSNVLQALKKLNNTASVLYIAAHPDDENTRLISYFANDAMSRTAYLSLTRGDGGQNLIGTEKGELLGLLRTQELMAARRIDGGEQFFTRAIDFGYSKTAKETFEFWNKDEILSDVVYIIRKFRPDVIITRFPPTEYAGHGHHTASAMLADEAFNAAADPNRFKDQFEDFGIETWQAKRLYFNTSSWWYKDLKEQADTSDEFVTIDIGTYNHVLGLGYGEMAAESRSQHKSQGFGSGRSRGENIEYLRYQKGDKVQGNDIFEGIVTDWTKFGKNGNKVATNLEKALQVYEPHNPVPAINALISARNSIDLLKKDSKNPLLDVKRKEIDEILLMMVGIHFEVTMSQPYGVPGEELNFKVSAIGRSDLSLKLDQVSFLGTNKNYGKPLGNNELFEHEGVIILPNDIAFSNPYWLNQKAEYIYAISNLMYLGEPTHNPLQATFEISFNGIKIETQLPIQYSEVDREKGELYRPFVIMPKATVNISNPVYLFGDEKGKNVEVKLTTHKKNLDGRVMLMAPNGWKVEPDHYVFNHSNDESEELFTFKVIPPMNSQEVNLKCIVKIKGEAFEQSLTEVEYDHVTTQTWLYPCETKAIRLNIKKDGENLLYVMGAGDDVPENLRQIGYKVNVIQPDELMATELSNYDAVLIGIRAYNTNPELVNAKEHLMKYVKIGGRMIVQYQTSRGIDANDFSPYDLSLTRDRVTDENSEINFIRPEHPVLNYPNSINKEDFDNWVQERGLYFAGSWAEQYEPILSWNDKGESPKEGALVIAQYGEGSITYTGISFFRELPAGVPGAFKLLSNIISYRPGYENIE